MPHIFLSLGAFCAADHCPASAAFGLFSPGDDRGQKGPLTRQGGTRVSNGAPTGFLGSGLGASLSPSDAKDDSSVKLYFRWKACHAAGLAWKYSR